MISGIYRKFFLAFACTVYLSGCSGGGGSGTPTSDIDYDIEIFQYDSSVDIGLPIWPSKLVVPVAFAVLVLRLCLQAVGYGRALILGLERPVSVPLTLSVAEQAELEARSLEGAD